MWYEILPSFGIIFAALAIPNYGCYWINKLVLGNHFKRDIQQDYNYHFYIRDIGLTGDGYKQQGLESIPDEEPTEKN